MKLRLAFLTVLIFAISCTSNRLSDHSSVLDEVDPFIGTGFHGHTFPGATTPHGMVQLSPDTRTTGWDACAGYHYSDSSIIGFSHTHLSGTGIGDLEISFLCHLLVIRRSFRVRQRTPQLGYRSDFKESKNGLRRDIIVFSWIVMG